MIKICFVCTGNTCRSVMAERLAKKELKSSGSKNIKLSSRGLAANGENITENAKLALKALGASSANRKSVKLGKLDSSTLYVAMTARHAEELLRRQAGVKVITFSSLIGSDIPDPYGQDLETYKFTAKQLQLGVKALLNKISQMESKI